MMMNMMMNMMIYLALKYKMVIFLDIPPCFMGGSVKKNNFAKREIKRWRLVVLEFGGDGEHRAVLILPVFP